MPKQQAQQTDIAQKAKDLFGEETVHVIDEDTYDKRYNRMYNERNIILLINIY